MGIESFIVRLCKQTAVYWGDPTNDGYGGQTFGSKYPEEINCRWEDHREVFTDAQGNELVSRAVVYVTEDVDEEGWLYLGDLDSTIDEDPKNVDGAYKIRRFDKSPALGSTNEFLRKVYL